MNEYVILVNPNVNMFSSSIIDFNGKKMKKVWKQRKHSKGLVCAILSKLVNLNKAGLDLNEAFLFFKICTYNHIKGLNKYFILDSEFLSLQIKHVCNSMESYEIDINIFSSYSF